MKRRISVFYKKICAAGLLCVLLFTQVSCAAGDTAQSSASPVSASDSISEVSLAAGSGSSAGPDSAAGEEGVGAGEYFAVPPAEGLYEPDFAVQAASAYLVNEESGAVVYAKNADQPFVPASLVKLMTCIIAMDMVADLDAETVLAERWVFNELAGKNASHADIWYGETLTVRELLYAMLLPSANEAALMLAGYLSDGQIPVFLQQMNDRARQLGCTGTSFADPNGLSEQNVTTARDMYLITREFMRYSTLVEIAQTTIYQMAAHNHPAPYNILTTNRLLVPTDPYAKKYPFLRDALQAGKTGSLGEWQNFSSVAQRNGETYYCVVLGSPNSADTVAFPPLAEGSDPSSQPVPTSAFVRPGLLESGALYQWAYNNFSMRPALDTTKPITEVTVRYSTTQDNVKLLPTSNLATVLPLGGESSYELEFDVPEFLPAPVEKGQVVGSVTLHLRGQVIGTSELVAAEDVQRNQFKYIVQKVLEFFGSKTFRVVIVIVLSLGALYAVLVWYASFRHRKRQEDKQKNPSQQLPPPGSGSGAGPKAEKQPPDSDEPPER